MRIGFKLWFSLFSWNSKIIFCNCWCMVYNFKLLFFIFSCLLVTKCLFKLSNWPSNKVSTWGFSTKLRSCNFNLLRSNNFFFLLYISPLILVLNFKIYFLPRLHWFTCWPLRFVVTFTLAFRRLNMPDFVRRRFLFSFRLTLYNSLCRLCSF